MRPAAILLAACVLLAGSALPMAQRGTGDTPGVTRGAAVYREQKCQACHSIAGVGNRRNPLDGVGSRLTVDEIRRWIVAPRDMNPRVSKRAYDSLPRQDLDALVAYLQSLQTP